MTHHLPRRDVPQLHRVIRPRGKQRPIEAEGSRVSSSRMARKGASLRSCSSYFPQRHRVIRPRGEEPAVRRECDRGREGSCTPVLESSGPVPAQPLSACRLPASPFVNRWSHVPYARTALSQASKRAPGDAWLVSLAERDIGETINLRRRRDVGNANIMENVVN